MSLLSQVVPATPTPVVEVLHTALDQSQDVRAEMQACAEDLGAANDVAIARIADGATTVPAAQALLDGMAIESRVQTCADDLQQVTDNLSHGVDEVKSVEQALARSRAALAESEQALAASRNAEGTASQLAMHDTKTGLPNRALFDDRLAQAIAGAEHRGWMLAVVFLDLSRAPAVADDRGPATDDATLRLVAERLMQQARDEDTVCRNGGDQFLYLLINPTDREAVARIVGVVRAAVEAPIGPDAQQFAIAPSLGIALYPEHGTSGPTLVARAEAAMQRARELGSPCEFFEPSLTADRPGLAPPLPVARSNRGLKVMAVDDDDFMRELLHRVLEGVGMQVTSFASAAELLATADLAEASVLILDINLPGMSGLDLQRLLRRRGIDVPVVFVSGAADLTMAVAAMRDGAADFVEKPFDGAQMTERVQRAVARHADRVAASHAAADPQVLARVDTLTPRERQVFDLLVTGMSSKLIARELGGSFRTIDIHRAQVMRKMEARHLADLVRMSIESFTPRRPGADA